MAEKIIKDLIAKAPNRRNFVRNLGIASAAVGVAAVVDPTKAEAQTPGDIDILNFALNLEYLEAEFYSMATTGQTIDQFGIAITGGIGTAGPTTGGSAIAFSTSDITVQRVAQELADDERTHVSLIQTAILNLGGSFISKPAINLNALGFGFGSEIEFLQLSRIFEDIGVTAYGGAAPLLTSTGVATAARILATEAEHVGNIRYLLTRYGASAGVMLDGVDIPTPSNFPPAGVKYFSTNVNALTEIRSPGEVLYLAYGSAPNATSGGFFPSGANGAMASLTTAAAAPAVDTGVLFVANPNPLPVTNGSAYGSTQVTWHAPAAQYIQIRIGSPTGPLFTTNFPSGTLPTGNWATEGMVLYLQDITGGAPATAAHTLGTIILRTYPA